MAVPRTLSSRATFLHKFVVPAGTVLVFLMAVGLIFRSFDGALAAAGAFLIAPVVAGATAVGFLVWVFGGLKQVTLDGDTLLVSNFRDTLRVPLRDVARVTPSRFTNPETIRLDLVLPCSFGQRITFLPPLRWLRGFSQHPLAAELAALVEAQRPGANVLAPAGPVWRRTALGVGGSILAIGAALSLVTYSARQSDAYRDALAIARADSALVTAIGEPMQATWLPSGAFGAHLDMPVAHVSFRVRGPLGSARIDASARYADGWNTERAVAHVDGRAEPIDLLAR